MKHVYLTLNWFFGVIFLLTGLISFSDSILAGLCLTTASALLLPPVRDFVYSKTNKELPTKARAISVFALFIAFGIFVGEAQSDKSEQITKKQEQEKIEIAENERQKKVNYFKENREKVISSINKLLAEKSYQAVVTQSTPFLSANDQELTRIYKLAKIELTTIETNKKIKELEIKLNSTPADNHEKNRSLYTQLSALSPNNELYKNKAAFYQKKIGEEKQAKAAEEARKKKIEPQFSSWDGSHRNLERAIKDSMNDPDSYEHVKTVYWDRGSHLVVMTTFRGKNAFGGVVKNSVKAKVGLNGQVLEVLDQN